MSLQLEEKPLNQQTADLPIRDDGRSFCLGPSKYWRLEETMNGFVLEPVPNRAAVMVAMGSIVTLATLPTVYFLELPWPVAVLGIFGGGMAMVIMYLLARREIDRGPYFVHRADRDEIDLPRYDISLPREVCKQILVRMIPHRTTDGARLAGELTFCVQQNDQVTGYVTVVSQHKSDVRQVAEDIGQRLGVPVEEVPYECE